MFQDQKKELPEFWKAMEHLLKNKNLSSITYNNTSNNGTKDVPMMDLQRKLFTAKNIENQETYEVLEKIVKICAQVFINNMKKK